MNIEYNSIFVQLIDPPSAFMINTTVKRLIELGLIVAFEVF